MALTALLLAVAFFTYAAWLLATASGWGALAVAMLGAVALAVTARMVRRLRAWPPSRLGFFRDRLALVQEQVELQATWDVVETATLASAASGETSGWSPVRMTDRLTVHLKSGRYFSLRPATFGLEPSACRDLVLRLRDDASLRARLPEFDSLLDLLSRPLQMGALIRPRL
jgi:hypothetical protein